MKLKPLAWIGSCKEDLKVMSEEIRDSFGYALYVAQRGSRADYTKVLQGFGGAHVIEIIENNSDGTYRAVYTVKFEDAIYVLHVFQKKSKSGIATPKKDIDLIKIRLKIAEAKSLERKLNGKERKKSNRRDRV